ANFYWDFRYSDSHLRPSIDGEQRWESGGLDRCFFLFGRCCHVDLAKPADRTPNRKLESGAIACRLEVSPEKVGYRSRIARFAAIGGICALLRFDRRSEEHTSELQSP